MFSVRNVSTPLFAKLPQRKKSIRRKPSSISTLFETSPPTTLESDLVDEERVEQELDLPMWQKESLYSLSSQDVASTFYPVSKKEEVGICNNKGPTKSYEPNVLDKKVFKAALQLFNKEMELLTNDSAPSSSSTFDVPKVAQRWECKGNVQASLQLCVMCKDIGKVRTYKETYYLNVMEKTQYRTILCKRCLAFLLRKHVGSCLITIKQRLRELGMENLT